MNKSFIYLATPYTHKNPNIQKLRLDAAVRLNRNYIINGLTAISPIAFVNAFIRADNTSEFAPPQTWLEWDIPILKRAEELWVMMMPGWDISVGVTREIKEATESGIFIKYIEPYEVRAMLGQTMWRQLEQY